MASEEPPIFYFNGINFNNSFFVSQPSGITEAEANSRYLRKKTIDTATALENFNAGINTTEINPITTSLSLVSGATNGRIINIMDGSNGTINMGTNNTIFNLNAPITPLYNPSVLSSGDIGHNINTNNNNNFTAGTISNICSLILPPGVWNLEGQTNPVFASLNDDFKISLSTSAISMDNQRISYIYYKSSGSIPASISSIFILNTTTTIFFNALSVHISTSNNNFLTAVRIA
jgi:hypothetical protein